MCVVHAAVVVLSPLSQICAWALEMMMSTRCLAKLVLALLRLLNGTECQESGMIKFDERSID